MDIAKLSLLRLNAQTIIKPFSCIDLDLNGFLFDDALNYHNALMAVTYILENEGDTVAYFSLLNDRIALKEYKSSDRNRLNRDIPNTKRVNTYPAVKVGRLAVSAKFAKQGIGSQIIDFIKTLFTTNNRTGCRYITVDAYIAALKFYEQNGFKYLTSQDEGDDTRLMYYDLKKFGNL